MKKIMILLFLKAVIFAGMIDGIAIIVNNEPITVYDIYQIKEQLKIDDKKARGFLVSKKLEESEIKARKIEVSEFELDEAFAKIAEANGMDESEFKNVLVSKKMSIAQFKEDLKAQVERDKLYDMIVKSKLEKPTDEEAKEFFEKNKARFMMPKTLEVIKYSTKNREYLINLYKNPMSNNPNIDRKEEILDSAKVNPRLLQVLLSTKDGEFTQILPIANMFVMYFIQKKSGFETLDFEATKPKILNFIYMTKRQEILDTYFKKLQSEANIQTLR